MSKIYDQKLDIIDIFRRAAIEGALIEIRLGELDKKYGARLLKFSKLDMEDQVKLATDEILDHQAQPLADRASAPNFTDNTDGFSVPAYLLITPLEPTDGNIKIRKAPKIDINFYLGVESYQTSVIFQKIRPINGGQAIQLSMPSLLRSEPRRQQLRVDIPLEMNLRVTVQRRGNDAFSANVVDISPGGLSFSRQEAEVTLNKDDKVSVDIHGDILQGTPISTFASVCSVVRARDRNNVQITNAQYGIQFKLLSVANAMTVDRLVRDLRTMIAKKNPNKDE